MIFLYYYVICALYIAYTFNRHRTDLLEFFSSFPSWLIKFCIFFYFIFSPIIAPALFLHSAWSKIGLWVIRFVQWIHRIQIKRYTDKYWKENPKDSGKPYEYIVEFLTVGSAYFTKKNRQLYKLRKFFGYDFDSVSDEGTS